MRYYFHLRIGDTFSPDEIGLDLPDVETAYLEAFKAAQDMWSELLVDGLDPFMRSFEISDGHQVLMTLPFREVLERARKGTATLPGLRQSLRAELAERRKLLASLQENVKAAHETIEDAQNALKSVRVLLDRKS